MESVELYFSFRSPYSWLVFHRLEAAFRDLPVALTFVPAYPAGDFPNDPAALPAKLAYLIADVGRIAEAYGLSPRWPGKIDTDWPRPHAAFLGADDRGRGLAFARAAFAARFERGLDLAADSTLEGVARACGEDPQRVVRDADDPALCERTRASLARRRESGVFGVPTFVYREQKFWGNDRLEWLVRAIRRDAGLPVPDLRAAALATPAG